MYNEKANKLKKPFKLFSKCKLRKLTPQNFLYIFLGVENFKGLVLYTTVNLHMKCLTNPFHSILHIQCISSCLNPWQLMDILNFCLFYQVKAHYGWGLTAKLFWALNTSRYLENTYIKLISSKLSGVEDNFFGFQPEKSEILNKSQNLIGFPLKGFVLSISAFVLSGQFPLSKTSGSTMKATGSEALF